MNPENRLYRSHTDRMLGGVLGGLAERLGTDPTLVRLAFVALTLVTGLWAGVVLYLVALIVVPEAPVEPAPAPAVPAPPAAPVSQ